MVEFAAAEMIAVCFVDMLSCILFIFKRLNYSLRMKNSLNDRSLAFSKIKNSLNDQFPKSSQEILKSNLLLAQLD